MMIDDDEGMGRARKKTCLVTFFSFFFLFFLFFFLCAGIDDAAQLQAVGNVGSAALQRLFHPSRAADPKTRRRDCPSVPAQGRSRCVALALLPSLPPFSFLDLIAGTGMMKFKGQGNEMTPFILQRRAGLQRCVVLFFFCF
jgi:hypothetical protein